MTDLDQQILIVWIMGILLLILFVMMFAALRHARKEASIYKRGYRSLLVICMDTERRLRRRDPEHMIQQILEEDYKMTEQEVIEQLKY